VDAAVSTLRAAGALGFFGCLDRFFFELFRGTIEFQFAPEGFDRLSDVAG